MVELDTEIKLVLRWQKDGQTSGKEIAFIKLSVRHCQLTNFHNRTQVAFSNYIPIKYICTNLNVLR